MADTHGEVHLFVILAGQLTIKDASGGEQRLASYFVYSLDRDRLVPICSIHKECSMESMRWKHEPIWPLYQEWNTETGMHYLKGMYAYRYAVLISNAVWRQIYTFHRDYKWGRYALFTKTESMGTDMHYLPKLQYGDRYSLVSKTIVWGPICLLY
jgi:hypothetical protein